MTRSCVICSGSFEARSGRGYGRPALYCSTPCRRAARLGYWARYRAPLSKKHDQPCANCGMLFETSRGTYCSTACRSRARYARQKANGINRRALRTPAQNRERNARRAALRRGASSVERIDPHTIFDRDGRRCYLCGFMGAPFSTLDDPYGLTLDHVIPLARGGAHSYANLRAAHRGCNSRKRDRMVPAGAFHNLVYRQITGRRHDEVEHAAA